MWQRWQFNLDMITSLHISTRKNDRHDASFTHQFAIFRFIEDSAQKPLLKFLNLRTWITQAREFKDNIGPNFEKGRFGQCEQIDPARGDVFTQLRRRNVKPLLCQLIEQFGLNEMDLTQIGLRGICPHTRPMFDGHSLVRIAFNTLASDNAYL